MESEVIAFVIEGRRYQFQTTFRNQSKTIKEITNYIHYSRVGVQYTDFLDRTQTLTQKLIKQGYVAPRLKSPLQ
jgi:hypothetical protein